MSGDCPILTRVWLDGGCCKFIHYCKISLNSSIDMPRNKVTVLYGSQTGQAESIATDIHEDGCFRDFDTKLFCLKDEGKLFNITDIECAIIVCSTTGDGDPPENARKFIRLLNRKTLPDNHLSHLSYALLGLGDSNYSTFCGGPKKLDKCLKKCGATTFYNTVFADDATDMEDTVEPWLDGLWTAVEAYFKSKKDNSKSSGVTENSTYVPCGGDQIASHCEHPTKENPSYSSDGTSQSQEAASNSVNGLGDKILEMKLLEDASSEPCLRSGSENLKQSSLTLPPSFPIYLMIEYLDSNDALLQPFQNTLKFPVQCGDFVKAEVRKMRQLTADDALKRTLEYELSSGDLFQYQPGDSFAICCENDIKEVDWLIQRLSLDEVTDAPAQLLVVENFAKKSVPTHLSEPLTIRRALQSQLEIRAVPKKPFLSALIKCTSEADEQRRLQELVSKQGAAEYAEFVRESNVCILDILVAFPSCKPSFCLLAQHLPRLMPRRYSLACSPMKDPNSVKFVFNVTRFGRNHNRSFTRNGVCTGMLERIFDAENRQKTPHLHIFPTKNMGFHLPKEPEVPIVMIGPGTGVAPFVGFLEHRANARLTGNNVCGDSWLFYGCRHENKDFLYKETFEKFKSDGILTHFHVAFSRDEAKPYPKYVQDCMKMHASALVSLLLSSNAHFYVCGDARNMAKGVRQCFVAMVAECTECTEDDALVKFKQVVAEKRYLEDIWT